jgi:RND family efflux transporter MFP subunit
VGIRRARAIPKLGRSILKPTTHRRCPEAAAGLLLAAVLAAGCSAGSGQEAGARGRGAQAFPVAIFSAAPRDLERTVSVTGPVEPIRLVSVNAQTAGTVVEVSVEEGTRVRVGQPLARLDARETTAQLDRARAILTNAEAAFRRAEQLRTEGLVPGSELDQARSTYDIARADTALWSTRLAFSRIDAPVTGVVTAKRIERGGAVSANQPLFEIAEDDPLVVRVRLSELDVVSLSPGRAVTVRLDAYPGVSLEGRVRRVFPSADAASRLVPVEVVLRRPPPGVEVRPGYLARVDFVIERHPGALAVPASALGVSDGSAFVYLVQADTLVRREVEAGVTAQGWVQITRGLAAGERVVTSGHSNLRPGAPVRARDVAAEGGAVP